jgi:hypothetical protein
MIPKFYLCRKLQNEVDDSRKWDLVIEWKYCRSHSNYRCQEVDACRANVKNYYPTTTIITGKI